MSGKGALSLLWAKVKAASEWAHVPKFGCGPGAGCWRRLRTGGLVPCLGVLGHVPRRRVEALGSRTSVSFLHHYICNRKVLVIL